MRRIIIVDDEEYCRVALGRLLASRGFTIRLASGGIEALAMLEIFKPTMVILDLNMPVMDGYAFLEEACLHQNWSEYGVVIYTADEDADVVRLLKLGAASVCRKAPGGLDCLINELTRHFSPLSAA